MKMYIVIKDTVPLGIAVNAAAHASLIGYLEFQHLPEVQEWLKHSFKKVVVTANKKEFDNCKQLPNMKVVTESTLDGMEVAVVLSPRKDWPNCVKFLRLLS